MAITKVCLIFTMFLLTMTCLLVRATDTEQSISKDEPERKRFLFFDSLALLYGSMLGTMYAAAGVSISAFQTSYVLTCVACKCYSNCIMGSDIEQQICGYYWHNINCAVASTPVPVSTTKSPVAIPQSNGANVQTIPVCETFCAVGAVSKKISITNANVTQCAGAVPQATPESYPKTCCKMPDIATWKQGNNVMSACDKVPHFTPVAKFTGGQIVPGSAGIFVTCSSGTERGFQFIHQKCGSVPELMHLSWLGPQGFTDPDSYFVITV